MPTVVIADDSPTLRRIVTSVLVREGFEVITAEDGVEAVQAVFRVQPDAVVLDVQMPREIHDDKQQVADLFRLVSGFAFCDRFL